MELRPVHWTQILSTQLATRMANTRKEAQCELMSFIINRVALFCTFYNRSMSFFRYGRHAYTQFQYDLTVSVYKCSFDHTQGFIS